jgi:succinyl-diaminopimelate desuccinylase
MAQLSTATLADPVALTRALCDIESVSGNERQIADAVEAALRGSAHLSVRRFGNTVMARTDLGRPQRVVLAGHLDTVPLHDNFPSRTEGDVMWGCGTSDMKSGTAVALWLAVTLPEPRYDVTYFFYECEEVETERNGLYRIAQAQPEWLAADFAVLLEPTYGAVEAGCQGTIRIEIVVDGVRAHAARAWQGRNAIHAASEVLRRLEAYQPREVQIDGCHYREGLNAVRITAGVASNVLPDRCEIEINFRFPPDWSEADAVAHLERVFSGFAVTVTDSAPGALPGLGTALGKEFITAIGGEPRGKYGWTDVSRFSALGIPALNYGPGDPNLAHKQDERVELGKIEQGAAKLHAWLTAG